MRITRLLALVTLSVISSVAACDNAGTDLTGGKSGSSGKGGSGGSSAGSGGSGGSGGSEQTEGGSDQGGSDPGGSAGSINLGGQGGQDPGGPCQVGPDDDYDKDGWSQAQGDCNDCDPKVNPGALDIVNYAKKDDGTKGDPLPDDKQVDEDCDGNFAKTTDATTCDAGLGLDVKDPFDAARSIGLCNVKIEENPADPKLRKWGVIKAGFSKISAPFLKTPVQTGTEVSILENFGAATVPREGSRLLALSSGSARIKGQPGFKVCDGPPLLKNSFPPCDRGPDGWPPGFPKQGTCGKTGGPFDGVGYDLMIRVPTNAKSLKFNFRFFSCEYPEYACQKYNDVFAVLMSPSPLGANDAAYKTMHDPTTNSADIAFDEKANVIGVNNQSFFTACEPGPDGYTGCKDGNSKELDGTGFDGHGASAWLGTQVPVPAGGIIYLRFAIWDSADGILDSTAVVDNFQWSADEGSGVITKIDPPIN